MDSDSWTEIGVWPDGDPVHIHVPGPPIPWATAKPGKGHVGKWIPSRQMAQVEIIRRAWHQTRIAPVPAPYGIVLAARFTMKEPDAHFGTGRNAHLHKMGKPDLPTSKPDLSNLLKLAEDALTTMAWDDDDQVVRIADLEKRYGDPATDIWVWLAASRSLTGPWTHDEPVTVPDDDQAPALF